MAASDFYMDGVRVLNSRRWSLESQSQTPRNDLFNSVTSCKYRLKLVIRTTHAIFVSVASLPWQPHMQLRCHNLLDHSFVRRLEFYYET